MHVYAVGELYNPKITRWQERIAYQCRSGGHELLLFFNNLTPAELDMLGSGSCKFALAVHQDVIFFLSDFGQASPWSDSPYSIHLVSESERTPPDPTTDNQRALLSIMVINADTGIIQRMRQVTFSPHFTRALNRAIRVQAGKPFDQARYDTQLAEAYRKYPTTQAMLAAKLADTKGGE